MAHIKLDVNDSIEFTAKLERLHRSAFPSAVRNTLNNAAFDFKKTVPQVGGSKFITRSKPFLRVFTTVKKAEGFNIKSMQSTAGLDASKDPETAANLAAHETGQTVKGRKLFAHDNARISKSKQKRVSRPNYMNKIEVHNANKAYRANKGTRNSKFVAAIYSTVRSSKRYMQLDDGVRGTVYEVRGQVQSRTGGNVRFKIKKLYNYRANPNYKARKNKFLSKTGDIVSTRIPKFYQKNAEFQFKKFLK